MLGWQTHRAAIDLKRMRTRVRISGRVQGVWFRESTRRRAAELGLAGWVRNLPDGCVEAEFEGAPEAVAEALAFVGVGPELAHVDDVRTSDTREWDAETPVSAPAFRIR